MRPSLQHVIFAAKEETMEEAVRLVCEAHNIYPQEKAIAEFADFNEFWQDMNDSERIAWLSGFISGVQAKERTPNDLIDFIEQMSADRAEDFADSVFGGFEDGEDIQ